MPDRTRLHELVDTLPDAALKVIQGALEKFQTWPLLEWGQGEPGNTGARGFFGADGNTVFDVFHKYTRPIHRTDGQ